MSDAYTYNEGGRWTGIVYACAMRAHRVCKGRAVYLCPRQPTPECRCKCHRGGNR